MRQNLPTNMYFAGRNGGGGRNINSGYVTGKSPCQISYVPKKQRPLSNGDNEGLNVDGYSLGFGETNSWYPTCRPLKQWRLRGTTTSSNALGSDQCCLDSEVFVGPPLKMLGKNEDGENKQLNIENDCLTCDPTRGPSANGRPTKGTVINFNGSANIISACTIVPKSYFQSYNYYLKARGNSYVSKSIVHKIPGVSYMKNGNVVWPQQTQHVPTVSIPVNSSYYYGGSPSAEASVTESKNCNLAIYKPSNSEFAVQGAVDSSTRMHRLKYNTITKNNQSFYKMSNQGVNLKYQSNPLFFSKNEFSRPQAFPRGTKTICGSNCVSKYAFNPFSALG